MKTPQNGYDAMNRTTRFKHLICGLALVAGVFTAPYALAGTAEDAVKAAADGRFTQAQQLAGRSTQVTRDAVEWMRLMSYDTRANYTEILSFVNRHPDWPDMDKLRVVAEGRMPGDMTDTDILNLFSRATPVTADGMARYMDALLRQRQTGKALADLKQWWPGAKMTASQQAMILSRFGQYLGTPDHARRLEVLLPAKNYDTARALAGQVGHGYNELVETRIAIQEGQDGVEGRLSRVPSNLRNDAGLMLSRLQYRRAKDMDQGAIEILDNAPAAGATATPEAWWKERNILTRRMIENHNYRAAYRLASQHGLKPEGADYAQAEWLAGWLALRFQKEPWKAFEHFERMFNTVKTPVSKSRAAYWAGRASDDLRHPEVALQWYQVAARYQTTFYGQLAAQRINLPLTMVDGQKPPVSGQQHASFDNRDLVQAVRLFHQAGLRRERSKMMNALLDDARSPQDFRLATDLAASLGQVDMAMKAAKKAERDSVFLTEYLFPTQQQLVRTGGAEPALVHALIRQESQFDQFAQSSAGALGLMQLMPATAKHTAQKAGMVHNAGWLTAKPEHNVRLGSLYINEMLNKYNGFMPLAIAAYNAGPGRVDQWIGQIGDPRAPGVDLIDWIEKIPVYETRNYVQRVMEGYNVYRLRLNNGRPNDTQPFSGNVIKTALNN